MGLDIGVILHPNHLDSFFKSHYITAQAIYMQLILLIEHLWLDNITTVWVSGNSFSSSLLRLDLAPSMKRQEVEVGLAAD
jgi:hypothetical protein